MISLSRPRKVFILIGMVILAIAVVYLCKGSIYSGLYALNLVPKAESFTELYLNDFADVSKNLPATIRPGSVISFSFTIRNLEGRATSYPYVVFIVADGENIPLDSNKVTLENNASTTISETYRFKHSYNLANVMVTLPQQNESLHFFIPNQN